jgi:hypothetical protein
MKPDINLDYVIEVLSEEQAVLYKPDGRVITHGEALQLIKMLTAFYSTAKAVDLNELDKSQHRMAEHVPGFVYLVREFPNVYKIGATTDIERRLKEMRSRSKHEMTLIHHFPSNDYLRAEQFMHDRFSEYHIGRDRYSFGEAEINQFKAIDHFDL